MSEGDGRELLITKQVAWLPVSDERIVEDADIRRSIAELLGATPGPGFSDEQVAAAQARIDARREAERAAWLALPRRTRLRRRLRARSGRLRFAVARAREIVALRIAPWLRSADGYDD